MIWLIRDPNRLFTNKKYRAGSIKVKPLELLVYHYTAGPDRPMRPRVESWLKSDSQVSTHFMISRRPAQEPSLQLAALDERTWHAGGSTWNGRTGINSMSIGIDLDNVGYLTKRVGLWRDSYNNIYKGPAPYIDASGRAWEPYTDEAIVEACRITDLICEKFPQFRSEPDHLVGHEDIMSTKLDPGPAFPWKLIRDTAVSGTYPGKKMEI